MTRVLVIEHEALAGAGLIGERLQEHGVELVEYRPYAGGEPLPENLDGYAALIVLGGSMGPTDDVEAPWLPVTRKLLAEAVEQELPTLGICLGAQLLSTATGGHVRSIPEGPEVGLCSVQLTEAASDDPLLAGIAGLELPVVQWHWLESDRLPPGAVLLASSRACANQVYRLGPRAWGLQFHPEALGRTAGDWVDLEDISEFGFDPEAVVGDVRGAEP